MFKEMLLIIKMIISNIYTGDVLSVQKSTVIKKGPVLKFKESIIINISM